MMTDNQQIEIAGQTVTIRPMCSADADIENDFVRGLSPEAKHYRFLCAVKELSPRELKQLCEVDRDRSMAFVATVQDGGREKQIGVSRYAPDDDGEAREIAITVADEWQHRGLGTRLARQLIEHAREHGVKRLYSIDFADNSRMRALAKDLGMTARRDPDDPHQVIYTLSLADSGLQGT
jgi:RimJ/RimL family protein N-acetyltransferase